MKQLVAVCIGLFIFSLLHAQTDDFNFNFGNVTREDFAPKTYAIDTEAAAVYLFDIGSTHFGENNSLAENEEIYERHSRFRILKKSAFSLATVKLFTSNTKDVEYVQSVENLQAVTYNLENGKVVTQTVDKSSVFVEKDGRINITKFTFPNVKEGSIVEFYATIRSHGIRIPSWDFQKHHPVLHSQYEVVIPFFYDYAVLKQGNIQFAVDTSIVYHVDYNYHQYQPGEPNTLRHVWRADNIPAIEEENFVSSTDNYVARVDFQLSAFKDYKGKITGYNRNWTDAAEELRNRYDFGYELQQYYSWLKSAVKDITKEATSSLQKAQMIYAYMRDHFKCTDYDSRYLSQPFKDIYQSKNGNVTDINLMLIAMLRQAGIDCDPVLLSTSDNGKIKYAYPTLGMYNYVVVRASIGHDVYLLDAADKDLSFNLLNNYCFNGLARIIDLDSTRLLNLSPDSLKGNIVTTAFLINDGENQTKGTVTASFSSQPSLALRKQLSKDGRDNYFKTIATSTSEGATISNGTIAGLKSPDSTITVKYDIVWKRAEEDIIYFSPLIYMQQDENPFTAQTRKYPIELPYCREETYLLTMDVPKNYAVDELPKPARVKLNEDEGSFEYMIAQNGAEVQMRIHIKLDKATFEPADYQTLRDFYAFVVKKEAEQIVFKKIK